MEREDKIIKIETYCDKHCDYFKDCDCVLKNWTGKNVSEDLLERCINFQNPLITEEELDKAIELIKEEKYERSDMNEFLKQYKIVNQEGLILTVKEKKE